MSKELSISNLPENNSSEFPYEIIHSATGNSWRLESLDVKHHEGLMDYSIIIDQDGYEDYEPCHEPDWDELILKFRKIEK